METRSSSGYANVFQGPFRVPEWFHFPVPVLDSYEAIEGYRGPRLPDRNHPCEHTKVRVWRRYLKLFDPDSEGWLSGLIPISAGEKSSDIRAGKISMDVEGNLSPSEANSLMREMLGEIPPLVNLPNMLLELPQTLSLHTALKAPMRELLKRAGGGVRGRLRNGSTALLAQQFGLFPLIGDLTKLMTSTKSIHSEVQRIQRLPAEWTPTRKTLAAANITGSVNIDSGSFGRTRFEGLVQTTGYVTYRHKLSRALPPAAQLATNVANDLFGFSNPAAVLWEATPFSFVADWFFPVGDYLSRLDQTELGGSLLVDRPCTCLKTEATGLLYTHFNRSEEKLSGIVRASKFTRRLGLPSLSSTLGELGFPGVKQSVLGSALAFQKYA